MGYAHLPIVTAKGYCQRAIWDLPCILQAVNSDVESVAKGHEANAHLQDYKGCAVHKVWIGLFVWVGFHTKVVTSDRTGLIKAGCVYVDQSARESRKQREDGYLQGKVNLSPWHSPHESALCDSSLNANGPATGRLGEFQSNRRHGTCLTGRFNYRYNTCQDRRH